ncbi:hypothetical protein ACBR42_15190, partial [Komagataeibacter sp. SM21]
ITAPNLLKTQTGCQRKNRQSNRQKPEITGHAHQLTVLRSLHLHQSKDMKQAVNIVLFRKKVYGRSTIIGKQNPV